MVLVFDSSAEVVQTFTSSKALLRQAVESIQPTDAPSSIDEAIRLATAYVGPQVVEGKGMIPGAPLFIWSDGCIPDLDKVRLHPDTRIEYHKVGESATHNTAITAMRAERAYDKPDEVSVFVAIQSTDPAPRKIDVTLETDGAPVAAKGISMPGAKSPSEPATGGIVFTLDRAERFVITARIAQPDALASDNAARIIVPPAKRLAVAIVSPAGGGNMFLESGIDGLGLAKVDRLSPQQFADLVEKGQTGQYDVFVMDRVDPSAPVPLAGGSLKPGAARAMPPGRYLTFGVLPALRGLKPKSDAPDPQPDVVADWSRDHPALRLTSFDALVVAKPIAITPGDTIRTLVRGSTGPLIVEGIQESSHAIVCCFDVLQSNWPFDVGFVLFLASSVQYPRALPDPTGRSRTRSGSLPSAAPATGR